MSLKGGGIPLIDSGVLDGAGALTASGGSITTQAGSVFTPGKLTLAGGSVTLSGASPATTLPTVVSWAARSAARALAR